MSKVYPWSVCSHSNSEIGTCPCVDCLDPGRPPLSPRRLSKTIPRDLYASTSNFAARPLSHLWTSEGYPLYRKTKATQPQLGRYFSFLEASAHNSPFKPRLLAASACKMTAPAPTRPNLPNLNLDELDRLYNNVVSRTVSSFTFSR